MKIKIKFIIILSMNILLFGFTSLQRIDAQTSVGFSVNSKNVMEKDTFTIAVNADSLLTGKGIYSFKFSLSYNSAYLEYLGIASTGSVLSAWGIPTSNGNTADKIVIAGAGIAPLSGKGEMFFIKFRAKSAGFTGISNVSGQSYLNEGTPAMTLKSGYVNAAAISVPDIYPDNATLFVGEQLQMNASGGTTPYTFFSDNPSVINCTTAGKITAISSGATKIYVVDSKGNKNYITGSIYVNGIKLSVVNTNSSPQDTCYLPIKIETASNTPVYSGSFELAYNANIEGLKSVIQQGDYNISLQSNFTGTVTKVSFASVTPITGTGILCKVGLKPLSSGTQSVSIQNALFNETEDAFLTGGNITITCQTSQKAIGLIPEEAKVNVNSTLDLYWQPALNAKFYQLYLWEEGTAVPTSPYHSNIYGTTTRVYLKSGQKYFWKIVSANECSTAESDVQTFTTKGIPDLLVENIQTPLNVESGADFTVTFDVKNIGHISTAALQWRDALYISASVDVNAPKTLLATKYNIAQLNVNESYTQSYTVKMPAEYNGQYYIYVKTDDDNGITELSENNNLASFGQPVTVALKPFPDVMVKNIQSASSALVPGDSLSINWAVQNIGNAAGLGGWTERITLVSASGQRISLYPNPVYSANIDVNATVNRSAKLKIPEILRFSGTAQVEVEIFPSASLVERTGTSANNKAISSSSISVQDRLFLDISSASLMENATDAVRCVIYRSGDFSSALAVNFMSSPAGNVTIPASVSIPVNASSAIFSLNAIDNTIVDGKRTITVSASATNYTSSAKQIEISDNEATVLQAQLNKTTANEGETLQLTITRNFVSSSPLTVYISTDKSYQWTFMNAAIIPANQASVTVPITITQDNIPELNGIATLTISSGGFEAGKVTASIMDDDMPDLEFKIVSDTIQESAGYNATYGTIKRIKGDGQITVNLSHTPTNALILPPSITLQPGINEVKFNIGVVDNANVDGLRTVTINAAIFLSSCGCSATSENGGILQKQIVIADNDGPTITLTVNPASLFEGKSNAGKLIITRNTPTDAPLSVTIGNNDPTEIEITTSAVIPIGRQSVEVPITTINDGIEDGTQTVTLSAYANGFSPGFCFFYVTDLNKPDYEIIQIQISKNITTTDSTVLVTGRLVNKGFLNAPIGSQIGFYLSKDNQVDNNDIQLALYSSPTNILLGDSIPFAYTLKIPKKTGDYYFLAKANPENAVSELVYTNNTTQPLPLKIIPDYSATAIVDIKSVLPNIPVSIHGVATKTNGLRAANVSVDVYILSNGRRTFKATTDNQGKYQLDFTPLKNESGHFAVGACYPDQNSTDVQDEFDIIGMKRTSNTNIIWLTKLNDVITGKIQIENNSNVPLTNLQITPDKIPTGLELNIGNIASIPGKSTADFNFTVKGTSITTVKDYETINLKVTSSEGATLEFPAYYYCQAQKAMLIAYPVSINTTMSKGFAKYYELVIRNNGAGESGKVVVNVPKVSFMSIVSNDTIGNILPNEQITVTLKFEPVDVPLNTPLTGNIAINCANGDGVSVPYKLEAVSQSKGTIQIDALDEYTYNTTQAPHLQNAHVTVRHPFSGAMLAEGFTNSSGIFTTDSIPEGSYTVTVEADKHEGWRGTVTVNANKTTTQSVFLSFQAISYTWEVVPTQVEDEYKIDLVMTYETNVPVPVVLIELPESLPALVGDETFPFMVTLTNKGLITARDVSVILPTDNEYEFVTNFSKMDLLAQQSIQIPVVMKRKSAPSGIKGIQKAANSTDGPCSTSITSIYFYECGKDKRWKNSGKSIDFEGRSCVGDPQAILNVFNSQVNGWIVNEVPRIGYEMTGGGITFTTNAYTGSLQVVERGCNPCYIDIGFAILGCIPFSAAAGAAINSLNCLYSFFTNGLSTGGSLNCGLGFIPGVGCIVGVIGLIDACFPPLPGVSGAPSKIQAIANNGTGNVIMEENKKLHAVVTFSQAFTGIADLLYGNMDWNSKINLTDFNVEIDAVVSNNQKFTTEEIYRIKSKMMSSDMTEADIDYFTSRWNRTMDAYQGDVFSSNAQYPDIIDKNLMSTYMQRVDSVSDYAVQNGYQSVQDMYQKAAQTIYGEVTKSQQAVCAAVSIKISQRLVMTREAFEGTLTINNGNDKESIKNIKLNLEIKNAQGVISNDLFQINTKNLDILTGIDGTGTLGSNQKGSATVIFIPTKNAAPETAQSYSFGGSFSYLDPFTGLEVTKKLFPVTLQVNPSPDLYLHYFMQRDILGDDPLTPAVEPIVPAELALMIQNQGFGTANGVKVESSQPEIVENEKGLAIHFALIGSNLNGKDVQMGLTNIDFGNIAPKSNAIGEWWFTSNLLGHFVSYQTNVVHTSSYGNPDLSLISGSTMHELIKSVNVYTNNDGINDFLVNEVQESEETPDMIYLSNSGMLPVTPVTSITALSGITTPAYEMEIEVMPKLFGWHYAKMTDPGNGNYKIVSVTRQSDGKVLPLNNVWQSHVTLPDGTDPIYENKIHFLDVFSALQPVKYTIKFTPKEINLPKVVRIDNVPTSVINTQLQRVDVVFNQSVDETSFTYNDLVLRLQGGNNQIDNTITIIKLDSVTFRINFGTVTSGDGYYVLTVQTSGIRNLKGVSGMEDKQATWTQYAYIPAIQEFIGLPGRNINAPFDNLMVRFTVPINTTTLTPERFLLTNNGDNISTAGITITSMNSQSTLFQIAGLSSLINEDGAYELSVDLPQIKSQNNVAGVLVQSVNWKMDSLVPLVTKFTRNSSGGFDNQHTTSIDIEFSEPVSGFGIGAVELWKDNIQQPLSQVNIIKKDSKTFTLTDFRLLTYYEGDYTLKVKMNNLSDSAGNAGIGSAEHKWSINRAIPAAITNLSISPDLGFSANDGITYVDELNVNLTVNTSKTNIKLYQNSFGNLILLAEKSNAVLGDLTLPVKITVFGSSKIEAYCEDSLGNQVMTEIPLYVDNIPLSSTTDFNPTSVLSGQPDSLFVEFSDKLLNESLILQSLYGTYNNSSVNLSGLTITKITETKYRIGNLIQVFSKNSGAYTLKIDLTKLQKYNSGKSGAMTKSISWQLSSNTVPFANAGSDVNATPGSVVTLDASASSDPDNNLLTYRWVAPFGIVLSDITAIKPTFTVPLNLAEGTELIFELIVNDGMVDSQKDQIKVIILQISTSDMLPKNQLYVSPNPASNYINIVGLKEKGEITIVNMTGNIILKKQIVPDEIVQLNGLNSGIYLVRINNIIVKLIVKKNIPNL